MSKRLTHYFLILSILFLSGASRLFAEQLHPNPISSSISTASKTSFADFNTNIEIPFSLTAELTADGNHGNGNGADNNIQLKLEEIYSFKHHLKNNSSTIISIDAIQAFSFVSNLNKTKLIFQKEPTITVCQRCVLFQVFRL